METRRKGEARPLPDASCERVHTQMRGVFNPTLHLHRGPTSMLFSETRLLLGSRARVLPHTRGHVGLKSA